MCMYFLFLLDLIYPVLIISCNNTIMCHYFFKKTGSLCNLGRSLARPSSNMNGYIIVSAYIVVLAAYLFYSHSGLHRFMIGWLAVRLILITFTINSKTRVWAAAYSPPPQSTLPNPSFYVIIIQIIHPYTIAQISQPCTRPGGITWQKHSMMRTVSRS